MHPEIIVEETEEDSEDSEDSEASGEPSGGDDVDEEDDVPTPLRPTDTFPFRRRNSPFLGKMSEDSLAHLRAINPDLGEPGTSPSPTPTTCSTLSRHEFTNWRINDEVMDSMLEISTICERNQICKTAKYVYTVTMANYTVTEWTVEGKTSTEIEKISKFVEDLCILRHKRLAPIYGYHWRAEETSLMVFRAHVPNGTVADLVKRSALPQETALRYIVHVIDALAYLHERHHVHGKINASNLLLTLSNDILLADPYIEGLPCPQKRRALLASPPEAFTCWESYPSLTKESDIWSVGCVLVTMLTRYPPFLDHFLHFHGDNLHGELIAEWGSRRRLRYTSENLIPDASKDIKDLVDALFVLEPRNRPSAHTLLETYAMKSRKTSIRDSLASLTAAAKEPQPPKPIDEFYVDRENDDEHRQLENLIEMAEKMQKEKETEGGFWPFIKWYFSRIVLFLILLVKWIGMVLCAGMSLAVVAGSVFFAIFLIYNGIQIACQCRLNEGFIVLIALILLPIIILLTTLCCNNSLDRYHEDVESGKVERSRFVMKTPERDVIVGGYILIDGKPREERELQENNRKIGISEGLAQLTTRGGDFLSGVARIA